VHDPQNSPYALRLKMRLQGRVRYRLLKSRLVVLDVCPAKPIKRNLLWASQQLEGRLIQSVS
jgi:hypothetical protein